MVDEVLKQLSPQFNKMYAKLGRTSIPTEQLLWVLYPVRSERLLIEERDYNILLRWFVGLNWDDPVWDATAFTMDVGRTLHGGWHTAGSMGRREEFSVQGARVSTAG